ncbi:MAG: nucleoside deaminase [Ruminococcaceae bacterium]|nr:nucleoside deaminase [Oscillospiraceae bacterium]
MDFIKAMEPALEAARKCLEENIDIPVGCAIYKDGELIATASNTRQQDNDITGHAEIKALKEAATKIGDWRLTDCTLFVTLEPCPMCSGAIRDARISTVVYGAHRQEKPRCHEILSENIKIFPGICEKESGELLHQFFDSRR